jgi:hypothetical protein
MSNEISFNAEMREKLRQAYEKAKEDKVEQFDFIGNTLVTNYAKYLLEYLDMQRLE